MSKLVVTSHASIPVGGHSRSAAKARQVMGRVLLSACTFYVPVQQYRVLLLLYLTVVGNRASERYQDKSSHGQATSDSRFSTE